MDQAESKQPRNLRNRVALITGVSRRSGIGAALAEELAARGAHLFLTGWNAHDAAQAWGDDPEGPQEVLSKAHSAGSQAEYVEADLSDPEVPRELIQQAELKLGKVDILVANHARSDDKDLLTTTAQELDAQWAVNVRSTLLLIQALAKSSDQPSIGRIVLLTSGQHLSAMPGEIGYVATKGAIHQLTATLAAELAPRFTVNAVNPGPTATGWASDEVYKAVEQKHPRGRWGTPADAARVIAWLVSDEAQWITGQVINSDGGFR